jgi:hypothetical protein
MGTFVGRTALRDSLGRYPEVRRRERSDAVKAQDFFYIEPVPSFSTLWPWSAAHGMPGTAWATYSAQQFLAAIGLSGAAALQVLGQGLHALQDAFSHDSAGAGMLAHLPGGVDPDDPYDIANEERAEGARDATTNYIRDFMRARGYKPKCPAAERK